MPRSWSLICKAVKRYWKCNCKWFSDSFEDFWTENRFFFFVRDMYTEKYADFQSSLKKSNDVFETYKNEMSKVRLMIEGNPLKIFNFWLNIVNIILGYSRSMNCFYSKDNAGIWTFSFKFFRIFRKFPNFPELWNFPKKNWAIDEMLINRMRASNGVAFSFHFTRQIQSMWVDFKNV